MGTLQETKTSGPDKKLQVLLVLVSDQAYLRSPWLDVGLLLWQQGEMSFDRDYFLPLPTPALDGVLHIGALFTDSAGFSLTRSPLRTGAPCCHPARFGFGPSTASEPGWTAGARHWASTLPSAAFLAGGPRSAARTFASEPPSGFVRTSSWPRCVSARGAGVRP